MINRTKERDASLTTPTRKCFEQHRNIAEMRPRFEIDLRKDLILNSCLIKVLQFVGFLQRTV